jgi:hypothetical protein
MIKELRQSGYDDFAKGTFENGGQNIYVSRKGILQRINHFDINRDGYADLVYANSHFMDERVPSYIYSDVFDQITREEIPSMGGYDGAIGDLNGDGYDDLVLANQHNGVHCDVVAYIYYGSAEGWKEDYRHELPVPDARAVAIGDFNGDGRPDIAFSSGGQLKVFYQSEKGFVPSCFSVLQINLTHLAASDLDGDGYADLYARELDGRPLILWGGPDGINLGRCSTVGGKDEQTDETLSTTPGRRNYVAGWKPKILNINGCPHVFRSESGKACFYRVHMDRTLGGPLVLVCEHAVSAACGDVNGDGYEDIVIACSENTAKKEDSWLFFGDPLGYSSSRKISLPTLNARDVCVADLNNNGFSDVIICQGSTDVNLTTDSIIFRGCAAGIDQTPVRVMTHDATKCLIAHAGDKARPQVVFVNREAGRVRGDVPCYVYYGSKNGFSEKNRDEFPGWSASEIVCCDFNDDGWADLLICNSAENAVSIDPGSDLYWNGPDGFDLRKKLVLPSNRTWGAAVGDFRHSGHLDIAVCGLCNPEIWIFHGLDGGYDLDHPERIMLDPDLKDFQPGKISQLHESFLNKVGLEYREPRWIMTADFNQDGWLDLFVSQIMGKYCFILWGGPEGFSMDRSTWLNAEGAVCAQAADLNHNGWLDLVIGSYQSLGKTWKQDAYIYIYRGGPDGFREDRRTQLPISSGSSLTIADFNNDGWLDIYAGSYHGGRSRDLDSIIFWGNETGSYSYDNCSRLRTHSASGCVALDFNEDGWIDLGLSYHKCFGNHIGRSQVWLNGPDGFLEKNTISLPTIGPHGMTTVCTGNIMNRSMEEYYVSEMISLPEGSQLIKLCWNAELPPKTWVRAQIRLASSVDAVQKMSWLESDRAGQWLDNGQEISLSATQGNWLQYRLALGATNCGNSPRVKEVTIVYEDNQK